jgi:hypothetical protein
MRTSFLLTAPLLFLIIFSCKKGSDKPATDPRKPDTTLFVNLMFIASTRLQQKDSVRNYELIVGDGSGTTLLDTIATVNTGVYAGLHTGKTTLTITSIYYAASYKVFRITTNTMIKPGTLDFVPGSDSTPYLPPPSPTPLTGVGDVFFKNMPSQAYGMTIESYYGSPGTYQPDPYDIRYSYFQSPATAVCILFPYLGQYKYHVPVSPHDTVDLSTMDQSVKVKFNVQPQYSNPIYQGVSLTGYPDTSSNRSMSIWQPIITATLPNNPGWDLAYPGQNIFKKYRFDYVNQTANAVVIYTDHWCNTVPVSPLLIDETYYTVASSQNNNFSINFLKGNPGTYITDWKGTSFTWQFTVPSDSTTLHPLADLSSMNSQFLKGQNLSSMSASDLIFGYQYSQGKFSPPGIDTVKQPPMTTIIKYFH